MIGLRLSVVLVGRLRIIDFHVLADCDIDLCAHPFIYLPPTMALVAQEDSHEDEADETQDDPELLEAEGCPVVCGMVAVLMRCHVLVDLVLLVQQSVDHVFCSQLFDSLADARLSLEAGAEGVLDVGTLKIAPVRYIVDCQARVQIKAKRVDFNAVFFKIHV